MFNKLIENMAKSPDDTRHGYWSDGEQIFCVTSTQAAVIANLLEDAGYSVVHTHLYEEDELEGGRENPLYDWWAVYPD